jgi:hypothetical protein
LFFAQADPNSAYWSINALRGYSKNQETLALNPEKTKDNSKTLLPKPATLRPIRNGANGRVLPTKIYLLLKGDLDIIPNLHTNPRLNLAPRNLSEIYRNNNF